MRRHAPAAARRGAALVPLLLAGWAGAADEEAAGVDPRGDPDRLSRGTGGLGGKASFKTMPTTDGAFTGGHGQLKELDIGTARSLLAGLLAAVRTPEAKKSVRDALKAARSDPQQKKMRKAWGAQVGPREQAEIRMQAIGPVLEEVAKEELKKAGEFKGGFMEAVLSIEQAGLKQRDEKIEAGMRTIRELVTGEKWDPSGTVGKIREFDVLAAGFAELDDEGMEERLKKAEGLIDGLTVDGKLSKPLAKLYLQTMQHIAGAGGIEAKGKEYVEKEAMEHALKVRLTKDLPEKERNKLMKRVNIYSAFLSPKENARIAQEIMKEAKRQAEEEADSEDGDDEGGDNPADEL